MKNFNNFLTELYLLEAGDVHDYVVRSHAGDFIDSHPTVEGAKAIANNVVNKGLHKIARVHGPNDEIVHDTSAGKFQLHSGSGPKREIRGVIPKDSLISLHDTKNEAIEHAKALRAKVKSPEYRSGSILPSPHFHVRNSSGKRVHSTVSDLAKKPETTEPASKPVEKRAPIVAPQPERKYPHKQGGEVYEPPVISDQSKGRTLSVSPLAPGTKAPEMGFLTKPPEGGKIPKPEKRFLTTPELTTGHRISLALGGRQDFVGAGLGQGRALRTPEELKQDIANITKQPTQEVKTREKVGGPIKVTHEPLGSGTERPYPLKHMHKIGYIVPKMGKDATHTYEKDGKTVDTGKRIAWHIYPQHRHAFGGHNRYEPEGGHMWTVPEKKPNPQTAFKNEKSPFTLHNATTHEQMGHPFDDVQWGREEAGRISAGSKDTARYVNIQNIQKWQSDKKLGRDVKQPGLLSAHHVYMKDNEGTIIHHTDPKIPHSKFTPQPTKGIDVHAEVPTHSVKYMGKSQVRSVGTFPTATQRTGSETESTTKLHPIEKGIKFASEQKPRPVSEPKPKGREPRHAFGAQEAEARQRSGEHATTPEPAKQTLLQKAMGYLLKRKK